MWRFLAALALTIAAIATLSGVAFARDTVPRTPTIVVAQLPPQARETLALIKHGGPFPYTRDGIVFGNFEKRLPPQPRGYYREYTVPTPGARNRGARRIIAGAGHGHDAPASRDYYYSDDHYRSFRRIVE